MLKNIVYLAAFTLVVIFSWVAFGLYNSWITTTINKQTQILITPIPASFDLGVIENITNRSVIQADLTSSRASATGAANIAPGTPTPAITNSPNATPTINPVLVGPGSTQSAQTKL